MTLPSDWALVELMGHRSVAGKVSEVDVLGVKLLRVEAPYGETTIVSDHAPSALYALTYTDEATVRKNNSRAGLPYHVAGLLNPAEEIQTRVYDRPATYPDCALCEGRPEGTRHSHDCPNRDDEDDGPDDHDDDPATSDDNPF